MRLAWLPNANRQVFHKAGCCMNIIWSFGPLMNYISYNCLNYRNLSYLKNAIFAPNEVGMWLQPLIVKVPKVNINDFVSPNSFLIDSFDSNLILVSEYVKKVLVHYVSRYLDIQLGSYIWTFFYLAKINMPIDKAMQNNPIIIQADWCKGSMYAFMFKLSDEGFLINNEK